MIGRLPRPVGLAPLTGAAAAVATLAAMFVSPAAVARPSAVGSHPRSVDLGHLDPTFGRGGRLLTRFGSGRNRASVSELAIQPDGKIVAVGRWTRTLIDGPVRFALARYTVRGKLDPSFGVGGKVVTSFGAYSDADPAALAIQPDGKLVVAGTDLTDTRGERGYFAVALARYNPGGALDRSFGAGGRVVAKISEYGSGANAAVLQADGRIVVAGTAGSVGPVLLRYTADGKLDPSFGTRGMATGSQFVHGLALQQDDKFVAAGSVDGSSGRRDSRDLAVSRYVPNGGLDRSFGKGGNVVTDLGAGAIANAIALQANGRVVAAGTRNSSDFAVVRYLTSGKLDGGFGRGGRVLTDFGPVWAKTLARP